LCSTWTRISPAGTARGSCEPVKLLGSGRKKRTAPRKEEVGERQARGGVNWVSRKAAALRPRTAWAAGPSVPPPRTAVQLAPLRVRSGQNRSG